MMRILVAIFFVFFIMPIVGYPQYGNSSVWQYKEQSLIEKEQSSVVVVRDAAVSLDVTDIDSVDMSGEYAQTCNESTKKVKKSSLCGEYCTKVGVHILLAVLSIKDFVSDNVVQVRRYFSI